MNNFFLNQIGLGNLDIGIIIGVMLVFILILLIISIINLCTIKKMKKTYKNSCRERIVKV